MTDKPTCPCRKPGRLTCCRYVTGLNASDCCKHHKNRERAGTLRCLACGPKGKKIIANAVREVA